MAESKVFYFDNNATTRVAPEVVAAMTPILSEYYGNPSSAYTFGHQVGQFLDEARARVAGLMNADPKEIFFTSCGTESNNTVLHSALVTQPQKRHVVTTSVEHSAIIAHCQLLKKQGVEVTFLPVDSEGRLDLHVLECSIRPDTALVSVMYANNETGVVFPIAEIAALCRAKGVLFHTDAVQTPGKIKLDIKELGVDFLSLSGHKLHAPKGVGMLYVKRRTKFQPYLMGGHQERGRRGGTENVASIVGFGKAAELAMAHLEDENTRVRSLRDLLETTVLKTIPYTRVNGSTESRLPNTSNIAFDFVEAESILMLFDQAGICASSGSACTTGSLDPSHVLVAMGISPMKARGSVRFSLGVYNTREEVDTLLGQLPGMIGKLRAMSPLNPLHPENKSQDMGALRARHAKGLSGSAE